MWKHDCRSQLQKLGKRFPAVISQDGALTFIGPDDSTTLIMLRSTHQKFPTTAGWHQYIYGNWSSMFLRLKQDGTLELHYFTKGGNPSCRGLYKNIPYYCGSAVGRRVGMVDFHYIIRLISSISLASII